MSVPWLLPGDQILEGRLQVSRRLPQPLGDESLHEVVVGLLGVVQVNGLQLDRGVVEVTSRASEAAG